MNHKRFFLILFLGIAMLGWGMATGRAAAHNGGEPRIVNEPAGPFLISIWTLPNPIQAGEANMIAALAMPTEDGSARGGVVILDADIEVTLRRGLLRSLTIQPSHEEATNKLFYETYFDIPAGEWTAEVVVSHEGQTGSATFEIIVPEGEGSPQIDWTLYGAIAVGVIGIAWFIWQSRKDGELEEA